MIFINKISFNIPKDLLCYTMLLHIFEYTIQFLNNTAYLITILCYFSYIIALYNKRASGFAEECVTRRRKETLAYAWIRILDVGSWLICKNGVNGIPFSLLNSVLFTTKLSSKGMVCKIL